jgi:hypothetical protein
MKRKKPSVPRGAPPVDADVDFIVGTVENVVYHEAMPPVGSLMKYVRGKGLVYMGKVAMPSADVKPVKYRSN